jgi:hypothetical protein
MDAGAAECQLADPANYRAFDGFGAGSVSFPSAWKNIQKPHYQPCLQGLYLLLPRHAAADADILHLFRAAADSPAAYLQPVPGGDYRLYAKYFGVHCRNHPRRHPVDRQGTDGSV